MKILGILILGSLTWAQETKSDDEELAMTMSKIWQDYVDESWESTTWHLAHVAPENVTLHCDDGRKFSCMNNFSHCHEGSVLYCNFSTEVFKMILMSHQAHLTAMHAKQLQFENEYKAMKGAEANAVNIIQTKLKESMSRSYFTHSRFIPDTYVHTDYFILCASFAASLGCIAGIYLMSLIKPGCLEDELSEKLAFYGSFALCVLLSFVMFTK